MTVTLSEMLINEEANMNKLYGHTHTHTHTHRLILLI